MIRRVNTSSRGQLLIVTAVVIAGLLISLAIVFNTALFTEAESTSVTFTDTARGESLKDSHITNIAQTIETENEQMDGSAAADTEAIISDINTQTNQRQTKYGAIVSAKHDSTTDGTRIEWDNANADLTNKDGNETWVVTGGIDDIRGYSMNFSTLPPVSDTSVSTLQSKAFAVSFNPDDASENAIRYVYKRDGFVHITGTDETGSVTTSCKIHNRPTSTIHFTTDILSSAVEKSPCRKLWPAFNVTKIQFENGDTASGEFEYNIKSGSVAPDDGGTHSEIETKDAVYAINISYDYTTDKTKYSTKTRIAPEEP